MKDLFFDQIELLLTAYETADAAERKTFDAVIDHMSAILYELLHPDEMEGERDRIALIEPMPTRRLLH